MGWFWHKLYDEASAPTPTTSPADLTDDAYKL